MKTKLYLAIPAALSVMLSQPIQAAKPGPASIAECGVTEVVLTVADGVASVDALFRNECSGVDMTGTAQLFIDGVAVGDPVALDASDQALLSAKRLLSDPAEAHEACLKVEGTASRKRGRSIVTEPLDLMDCQTLLY